MQIRYNHYNSKLIRNKRDFITNHVLVENPG